MTNARGAVLAALLIGGLAWTLLFVVTPGDTPAVERSGSAESYSVEAPGGASPAEPPARGEPPSSTKRVAGPEREAGRAVVPPAPGARGSRPDAPDEGRERESPSAAWDRQLADEERNDFRYEAAAERFATEPVDAVWSAGQTRAIEALAGEWGVPGILSEVECRSTLCRVRVAIEGDTLLDGAMRAMPVLRALGRDVAKDNEYGEVERHVVVYQPRPGYPLPEPPEAADAPAGMPP